MEVVKAMDNETMTKNDSIIMLAEQLKEEAAAIIKYSEDIAKLPFDQVSTVTLLEAIRLDEIEHIQKLTVELTTLVTESLKFSKHELKPKDDADLGGEA